MRIVIIKRQGGSRLTVVAMKPVSSLLTVGFGKMNILVYFFSIQLLSWLPWPNLLKWEISKSKKEEILNSLELLARLSVE